MNKRSFLFLLIFLAYFRSHAQEVTDRLSGNYFNLGAGYTVSKFLDNSFSTLIYAGNAAAVTGGLHFNRPTQYHHVDVRFDYGEASNITNFGTVESIRFEGNYTYNKYIRSFCDDRIRWFAGGSVNGLWQLWIFNNFTNNAYDNSIYVSVSPNTSLAYDFRLFNRNFSAGFSAFLPLLTFAVRPSYGASSFSGFLDRENDKLISKIFDSGNLTSLNKFFRYSNTFSLDYAISNGNRLRLSYTWNIVRYSEPRMVTAASHNISLSTMFNF